ncbi:hypothetical protein CROQUDRAFT_668940 [Cronartium quercuum f. sp. fusiforme G11]|uniref:Sugar phosphate transporter domain-containing protein n=1 Tax=Cronartium quercuum f. sp. fusiforme G11 TaxID=708437 RepID=A0A9P6NQH9_9BASI|nr:hypothetical protein CROQUDRAFT_668940 [Cronartium quercuum f. sp. fusiforme G11]
MSPTTTNQTNLTHTISVWNSNDSESSASTTSPPSTSTSHSHSNEPINESPDIVQSNPNALKSYHQRLFPPWLIISTWITISSAVIFYNALILRDWGFPYPITLTTLHLTFQTCATQLLARFTTLLSSTSSNQSINSQYVVLPTRSSQDSPSTTSPPTIAKENNDDLMTSRNKVDHNGKINSNLPAIERDVYWKKVVPIGLLFSVSLVLSNAVYLYLSVAFIQMIKAASPVAVLLTSFAFGIYPPSSRLFGIVLLISIGIGIASYGEVAFSLAGFIMQVVAIVVEANRVVLIQMLLGTGLSPMTSLYFFAPVCLIINASLILPLEGLEAIRSIPKLGIWVIFSNASLTFLLNISAVYLIQLSSLILSLSKVVKDLILIFGSTFIIGNHSVTLIQCFGYLIALIGLVAYKKGI